MPRFVRYHAAIPFGSFTLKNTPPMPVTCSFCESFGLEVVSPDSRCGTAQPHTMIIGKTLARGWIRIRFMTGNERPEWCRIENVQIQPKSAIRHQPQPISYP